MTTTAAEIAVTTNSHRQAKRLPEGSISSALNGTPITLGSKTRVWYYPESMRQTLESMGFKVHARETKRRNEQLAYWRSIMHSETAA